MDRVPAPYYNDPQLVVKLSSRPHIMCPWGRGTGKTTIIADKCDELRFLMPRGKIGLCGLTYFHLKTKSLPAIIDQWERLGLKRNAHYFVFERPPKRWKWPEAYQPPLDYRHCITFFNGFTIELISFDRPEMARSGNYDFIIGDEAAKLKKSALDSDVLASNRGNKFRFGHLRMHHGTMFTTTMPLTVEGQWIFDYEQLMEMYPNDYLYFEASALENIEVLGEKYFRDNKRVMPDVVYRLEILNERMDFTVDSFYPKLGDHHVYTSAYDYSFYDGQDIGSKDSTIDSRGDRDCTPTLPLDLTLDFGARINCCVVGQEAGDKYRLIKNFYCDHPKILDNLVQEFCEYYAHHTEKVVNLWGGSDGNKATPNSQLTYFDQTEQILRAHGWTVILHATTREIGHSDKFIFFNNFLTGGKPGVPELEINESNCMETIVSMKNAPLVPDQIKKDKRSERKVDLPQWKATHLSDAVDNLLYWKFHQLYDDVGAAPPVMIR